MTEIDSLYIKASRTVSNLVWKLLSSLDANDAEPGALSSHDKDLLIDMLRYGTIVEVAKVRKSTIEIIRKQYFNALSRLQPRVYTMEQVAALKAQLADTEENLRNQRVELLESKARLAMMEPKYWEQQKTLNTDQEDVMYYKNQYEKVKQENEDLKRLLNQTPDDLTVYKKLYEETLREKRKILTKYETLKQNPDATMDYKKLYEETLREKRKILTKYETTKLALEEYKNKQREKELKLKSRVSSLEHALKFKQKTQEKWIK